MLLLIALLAYAPPTGQLSAPTVGYTLSDGRLVHLAGIPGACNSSFETADEYTLLDVPSNTSGFLAVPKLKPASLIYRTAGGQGSVLLPDPVQRVAISPAGSYFAALTPSRLWLYQPNQSKPTSFTHLNTLLLMSDEVQAIAVGDRGDLLLSTAGGIWYSERPGAPFTPQPLSILSPRFAPRDHLVIAFEPGQGRLIALHPTAGFAVEPLLSLESAPSFAFSQDGHALWVAHGSSLIKCDLTTRQSATFPVAEGRLQGVVAPGIYLWSTADGPTLLDTTQGQPSIVLFPVPNRAGNTTPSK